MKYKTITRENIKEMVERFYGAVRRDDMLSPVFTKALGNDWTVHLEKLAEFWSTLLLGTRSFQGNVYGTHMALEGIEPEHFRRWLGLFEQTVGKMFEELPADQFRTMARRIASSLQLGFFGDVKVQY
jgi:hemoglobin